MTPTTVYEIQIFDPKTNRYEVWHKTSDLEVSNRMLYNSYVANKTRRQCKVTREMLVQVRGSG